MGKKKLIAGGLVLAGLLTLVVVILAVKGGSEEKQKMEKPLIREPAVAGQFYPAQKEVLEEQLALFFSKALPLEEVGEAPNFLIVPHAGYPYSGSVAAQAFAQVKGGNFKTVILLGPSHQAYFAGAALDGNDFWQTPLGRLALDKEKISKLQDKEGGIIINSLPHENEHCLEVLLPFLQTVGLEDLKIIPILLGQADEAVLSLLAQKISNVFDEQTLLVVSSDLSHYPPANLARAVDEQTVAAILSGKEEVFSKTLEELSQNYPQVATFACGEEAIRVGLKVGQALGMTKQKLFSLTNSGEVTGEKERAVGYAAIGFWLNISAGSSRHSDDPPAGGQNQSLEISNRKQILNQVQNDAVYNRYSNLPAGGQNRPGAVEESQPADGQEEFSQEEKEMLLSRARGALENYFGKGEVPDQPPPTPRLAQKRGVFVTLKKNGQLRGCIGDFSADEPLWEKVKKMALAAAFDDPRFLPLSPEELEEIKIEISVLSPMRKVNSVEEIEMGKHGVYLKYGQRSATFLPQVAEETGWSREEFLTNLCVEKAGLPADCWRHPEVELFTYTAEVFQEE